MSKKIKKIQIEAFRAYQTAQEFEFVNQENGEIADLTLIYAPNGYGKTSFFDAVEWAVTGDIGRFKNKAIKDEIDIEEGHILKNRNAEASYGKVKLVSEDDEEFEIHTKQLKGRLKTDYKPGEPVNITGVFRELNSNLFCTTNMLAYDKITSFLQSYRAKDKTEALKVFWDDAGYSDIVQRVGGIYNYINTILGNQTAEKSRLKQDLSKYRFENKESQELGNSIAEFNHCNKNYEIIVNDLNTNLSETQESCSIVYERLKNDKLVYEEKHDKVQILLSDFMNYSANKEIQNKDIELKEELGKQITAIQNVASLKKKSQKLTGELKLHIDTQQGWEDYVTIVNAIRGAETKKVEAEKKQFGLQKEIVVIDQKAEQVKQKISLLEEHRKNILTLANDLEDVVAKTNYSNSKHRSYSRLVEKGRYLLGLRRTKEKTIESKIEKIEYAIDNVNDLSGLRDVSSHELIEKGDKLNQVKQHKELINNNIVHLEKGYARILDLQNKLNKLLIQGKEFVSSRQDSSCPLCQANYSDLNDLIRRIPDAQDESSEIKEINKQLQENKEISVRLESEYNQLMEEIIHELKDMLVIQKSVLSEENTKIRRLNKKLNEWLQIINEQKASLNVATEKYKILGLDILNEQEVSKTQKYYKEETKKFDDQLNVERENATLFQKESTELYNQNVLLKIEIVNSNEQLNDFMKQNVYVKTNSFISERNYRMDNAKIGDLLSIINKEKNKIELEIQDINVAINNNEEVIKGEKEEIEKRFKNVSTQIIEREEQIKNYVFRCEKLLDVSISDKNTHELLKEYKEGVDSRISQLDSSIKDLNSIISGINVLKDNNTWVAKNEEYQNKKKEIQGIEERLSKLQGSIDIIQNYMVDRTNEYFKSEIINQIYSKIDPHPTMNHIKFQTEGTSKGLQTHIYTYNKSEEDRMSPVLYLSSAQVNVLSLSIFLAKVLTEKDVALNTIFMDDPIQHLGGINLLAFIDLLRIISSTMGRQIVISTHDEHFFELTKVKLDSRYYRSKFIRLASTGEIQEA